MDAGTLELVELEDLLSHNLECESSHTIPGATDCSHAVTARIHSCSRLSFLGCAVIEAYTRRGIALNGTCWCGRHVADCWTVTPV